MASFWPFGRDDTNSPKSFEKALVTLSDKIQRLQIRDDTLRATHRRVKVILTLYGFLAYIFGLLILTLVTGWQQWRAAEWSAIAGSPVAILALRYIVDLYFVWREDNVKTRLNKKLKERDAVIKKLKDATKYDSTKELLDKYGGVEKKQAQQAAKKADKPQQMPQRTGFAPPPTANIPGRVPPPPQNAIDARLRSGSTTQNPASAQHSRNLSTTSPQYGESFAPNAFDNPPPLQQQYTSQPTVASRPGFLERMLDLLAGEDENAAKNRIVLICSNCRTVNGQAPPGTHSLADIGKWRCGTCGAWNGEESEAVKALKAVGRTPSTGITRKEVEDSPVSNEGEKPDDVAESTTMSLDTPPAASARSRARQPQNE